MTSGSVRYFRGGFVLVFLLCLLVVAGLYGGAVHSWWCCDDPQILKHALRYSPLEYFTVPAAWRALIPYSLTPWLSLTYDLDHTLFGLNPLGFYAHNLLTVTLCACLIYCIARQWVDRWHAAGGALLFLVGSPIMTASYQLMVRHYVEGLFFYLLALWLIMRALRGDRCRPAWLAGLAGLAFVIAATAKELYLPLGFVPFLLPLGSFRQRLQAAWPLLLVMLLYVPWRWYMLGDVVGGYTPASELGRSDLLAAFGQFANIPGLLLTLPWLALPLVMLMAGFLLFRNKRNGWVLLLSASLPVFLLLPLVPLARMPGIGAGSDRYFIALWAAAALVSAIVLGRAAMGDTIRLRLCTLAMLLLLVLSAAYNTRQVYGRMLPELREQSRQGQTLVTAESRDVIYLTPNVAAWYVSGIIDLHQEFGRRTSPPLLAADELDLHGLSLTGRRVLRYDAGRQAMVDQTPQVLLLLAEWRNKVRSAPLSVEMVFDAKARIMSWQLGPAEQGSYTILPAGGRQPVPARGTLRMDKPPDGSFRFRYDAPDGWIAYTPLLQLTPDKQGRYKVTWRGTGISLAEPPGGHGK